MKRMTNQQFIARMRALQNARKIFIETGLTNNISHAFEAYIKILADEHLDIFMKTMGLGRRPYNWVDINFIRPTCPDCEKAGRPNIPLYLRLINLPKGKQNVYGYKTAWMCTHPDCVYELFSKKSATEWMNTLETRNGKKEVVKSRVVKGGE